MLASEEQQAVWEREKPNRKGQDNISSSLPYCAKHGQGDAEDTNGLQGDHSVGYLNIGVQCPLHISSPTFPSVKPFWHSSPPKILHDNDDWLITGGSGLIATCMDSCRPHVCAAYTHSTHTIKELLHLLLCLFCFANDRKSWRLF